MTRLKGKLPTDVVHTIERGIRRNLDPIEFDGVYETWQRYVGLFRSANRWRLGRLSKGQAAFLSDQLNEALDLLDGAASRLSPTGHGTQVIRAMAIVEDLGVWASGHVARSRGGRPSNPISGLAARMAVELADSDCVSLPFQTSCRVARACAAAGFEDADVTLAQVVLAARKLRRAVK